MCPPATTQAARLGRTPCAADDDASGRSTCPRPIVWTVARRATSHPGLSPASVIVTPVSVRPPRRAGRRSDEDGGGRDRLGTAGVPPRRRDAPGAREPGGVPLAAPTGSTTPTAELEQLLLRQTYRVDPVAHAEVHATVQRAADALGVVLPIEIYVDEGGQGSDAQLVFVPDRAVLVLTAGTAAPARCRRAVRGRGARAGAPRAVDGGRRPVPGGVAAARRGGVRRPHPVGVPRDRPAVPAGHRAGRGPGRDGWRAGR